MSASLFDLGLRLHAHHTGQLVPRSAVRRFAPARDIHLLGVVAAPGDHGGLWGVAWAMPGGAPAHATVPDPRGWKAQAALWDALGKAWENWLTLCQQEERPAQFALVNKAAVARVAMSARRVATAEAATEHAKAAARAFTIAYHQSRIAGQQSILSLIETLQEHFITGAHPVEEHHLGTWLHWPANAATWATSRPAGWDDTQLALPDGMDGRREPLGRAWDRLEKSRDRNLGPDMTSMPAGMLQAQIAQVVRRRYQALNDGYRIYQGHDGPVMDATRTGLDRDGGTYTRLMSAERIPATRAQEAKWNILAARERAAEQWQPALYAADALERACGIASGDVLQGVATNGRIRTRQDVLRIRPDDYLTTGDGPTIRVLDLIAEPDGGLVVHTNQSQLNGPVTAWAKAGGGAVRPRPQISWMHDPEASMPPPSEPVTHDLLERVKALAANPA